MPIFNKGRSEDAPFIILIEGHSINKSSFCLKSLLIRVRMFAIKSRCDVVACDDTIVDITAPLNATNSIRATDHPPCHGDR